MGVVDVDDGRGIELTRPADRVLIGVGLQDARRGDVRVERQRATRLVLGGDSGRIVTDAEQLAVGLHDPVRVADLENRPRADAGGVDRSEQDVRVGVADVIVDDPSRAEPRAAVPVHVPRQADARAGSCSCLPSDESEITGRPADPRSARHGRRSARITKFGFLVWSIAQPSMMS